MKKKTLINSFVIAALCVGLLAGCKKSPGEAETSVPATTGLSGTLKMSAAPAEVLTLEEAVQRSKAAENVTISGRVGGTVEPITEGLAAFMLADEEVWFCDEGESDHCPTPWDACCENPETVQALSVIVEFQDATGVPLRGDLNKDLGLMPNQTVAVTGKLTVDANGNKVMSAESFWIMN